MKHIRTASFLLTALLLPTQVFGCSQIYIGSNLTTDGSLIFGRLEEYYEGYVWPKIFDFYPARNHKAGEEYHGCYGFSWVFTHDSYSYTGFSDNVFEDFCPDCEGSHEHTPYQAGGTNEKGLSVTATETMYAKKEVLDQDPYRDAGIEEAEIVTVLLGEAASAREAMELLTGIYDTHGACDGGGVLVADSQEAWYIENLTGTQYLAVRLGPDMVFFCPNLSCLGLIDLDDTENIRCSGALIDTAIQAGTFVGDEEEKLIDFEPCFEEIYEPSLYRLARGLNYLSGAPLYPEEAKEEDIEGAAYRISNVDESGAIVTPYTNIRPGEKFDIRDAMDLFRQDTISRHRSLETHIFQISDESDTGTVEWFSMGENRTNVFVPYHPMLTTDVYEPLRTTVPQHEYSKEEPGEGTYSVLPETGDWVLYPEGWKDTYFWPFVALEHLAATDPDLQESITQAMTTLQDEVFNRELMGNEAAEMVHQSVLALLEEYGW